MLYREIEEQMFTNYHLENQPETVVKIDFYEDSNMCKNPKGFEWDYEFELPYDFETVNDFTEEELYDETFGKQWRSWFTTDDVCDVSIEAC